MLQTKGGIKIHQKVYIEEIQSVQVDNPSQKDRILSPKETQQLRRIAGQLNWVSTHTRPDMTYAASIISGSIKDATVRDLITANKFFKSAFPKDCYYFPRLKRLQVQDLSALVMHPLATQNVVVHMAE